MLVGACLPSNEVDEIRPELQIRGVTEDNLKIFVSLFLNKNICCDPSLESSRRDGSVDGSQHMI